MKLTLKNIMDKTKLTKPTVRTALADLETARVIETDAALLGPTQVRTYTRISPELWKIQALLDARAQTRKNICPVEPVGKNNYPVTTETGKNICPVDAQTGKNIFPLIKKERSKKKEIKESDPAATAAAPATPATTSKRSRKLTDEQLAAGSQFS